MKTLLIMRHADATWDEDQWPDFERPLTPTGMSQAPQMGRRLKNSGLLLDGVVCSSALRTRQTAMGVATELGLADLVQPRRELYMAALLDWEQTVRSLADDWSTVLCVAHNPGVQDMIRQLRRVETRVPPATLAIVQLGIESWAEFRRADAVDGIEVWFPEPT